MGRRGCKHRYRPIAALVGLATLLAWGVFSGERVVLAQLQAAPDPQQIAQKAQRRQELLRELEQIEKELGMPTAPAPPAEQVSSPTPDQPVTLEPVRVLATRMEEKPIGRAVSTVEQEDIEHGCDSPACCRSWRRYR